MPPMDVIAIPGGGEQFCAQCPTCDFQFHPTTDGGEVACINPTKPAHSMTLTRVDDEIDTVELP